MSYGGLVRNWSVEYHDYLIIGQRVMDLVA